MGAVDIIPKPFVGEVLRARVDTHLQLRHARELLKQQRNLLEHVVDIKSVTRDDQLAAHRVPPQLMGILPAARTYGGSAPLPRRPIH